MGLLRWLRRRSNPEPDELVLERRRCDRSEGESEIREHHHRLAVEEAKKELWYVQKQVDLIRRRG